MSDQKQSNSSYTTDGKVQHFSKNQEVNAKLAEIIGEKFIAYRKRLDANKDGNLTPEELFHGKQD